VAGGVVGACGVALGALVLGGMRGGGRGATNVWRPRGKVGDSSQSANSSSSAPVRPMPEVRVKASLVGLISRRAVVELPSWGSMAFNQVRPAVCVNLATPKTLRAICNV
jgi:hypothetical protein